MASSRRRERTAASDAKTRPYAGESLERDARPEEPLVEERGELRETPLARVLIELWRRRFVGALRLARDRCEKRVWFREGTPVFSESNLASESLGVQLLDQERITREDYSRVVEHVGRHRVKEGVALLALELLDPKSLFLALKEQVRRRVLDCFGWVDGHWEIEADREVDADVQAFRVDPCVLVRDGLTLHWSPDRILADLGAKLNLFPHRTDRFERLVERIADDPSLDRFCASVDGFRPFGAALPGSLAADVLATAWVLAETGAVDFRDRSVGDEKEDPPGVEREPEPDVVVAEMPHPAAVTAGRERARAGEGSTSPPKNTGDDALRREVLEAHADMAARDHYEMLGIARDASGGDVKRAYFKLAKRLHPDSVARAGLEDLRRESTELFARIGRAYEVLSDPGKREAYDADESSPASMADAERAAQAEGLFRKGEILLRAGNFAGALQFLRPCVEIWPEEADYRLALGWALYKKAPPDPQAARPHIEKARELKPDDPVVIFRLGMVLRSLGEDSEAAELLAKARSLDPKLK